METLAPAASATGPSGFEASQMLATIQRIVGFGVRRPGYAQSLAVERWLEGAWREAGLTEVRQEPVPVNCWEPSRTSLTTVDGAPAQAFHTQVAADVSRRCLAGDKNAPTDVGGYSLAANRAGYAKSWLEVPCSPIPYTAWTPTGGLEAPAAFVGSGSAVDLKGVELRGRMAVLEARFTELRRGCPARRGTGRRDETPARVASGSAAGLVPAAATELKATTWRFQRPPYRH